MNKTKVMGYLDELNAELTNEELVELLNQLSSDDIKGKTKIELDTKCCGKEMVKIDEYLNNGDVTMYVCSECGGYHQINKDHSLDEEELEDLKQNFTKEFGIEED